jgi:hypothetical protein
MVVTGDDQALPALARGAASPMTKEQRAAARAAKRAQRGDGPGPRGRGGRRAQAATAAAAAAITSGADPAVVQAAGPWASVHVACAPMPLARDIMGGTLTGPQAVAVSGPHQRVCE